jgi:hypothetical protein
MADDDDISRRYRELPREEPPRHLDDAILAAARRAVHTRPAPLVVPTGRQRWYFPLAAAAIIVLAVAVTDARRARAACRGSRQLHHGAHRRGPVGAGGA